MPDFEGCLKEELRKLEEEHEQISKRKKLKYVNVTKQCTLVKQQITVTWKSYKI